MTSRRPGGFTLIEVLVSMAVIGVGLLGIAAMDATALGTTTGSGTESVAAVEAQSLADAITVNTGYWKAGVFPVGAITVDGTTISDATLAAAGTQNCAAGDCTPLQLAAFDLEQWGTDLQSRIPGATGTITCQLGVSGNPNTCAVTVNWTAKAAAALNSGTKKDAATVTPMSYTLLDAL